LQLQEGGKLHILKEKWWKQRKGGGKCKVGKSEIALFLQDSYFQCLLQYLVGFFLFSSQEVKDSGANELGMKNVGGVFLVLVAGLTMACMIACGERYWVNKRKKVAHKLVSHTVFTT
jgi:ionotropic glutamate receptor